MIKIARYYLPWLGAILAAIALLFAQANLDLALPDYLSRIINVGIQQQGIESPVPDIMRAGLWQSIQDPSHPAFDQEALPPSGLAGLYAVDPDNESLVKLTGQGSTRLEEDSALRHAFLYRFVLASALDAAASGQVPGGTGTAAGDAEEQGSADTGTGQLPGAAGANAPDYTSMLAMLGSDDSFLSQAAITMTAREYELAGIDTDEIRSGYILRTGGLMLLLTLLSAIATISVSYIGARVSAGIARTLRGDLFRKVESFSAAEIDRFSTASLITRSTNDITQVQTVTFLIIRMVFLAPIMGIGGVVRALGKAPDMAWLIGLTVAVLLVLVLAVMALALPRFKAIQKLTDRLNRVAREQLNGLPVVRAFNRQNFETTRFDEANRDLTSTNLFVMRVMATMMPLIMLIMNLLTVSIIWIGADRVASASLQVGDMMAFLQYAMQIVWSFLMLTMVFVMIPRASVSANRIAEVLDTEPGIKDAPEAASLPARAKGLLEFRNVGFSYPGAEERALENISFTARPGQTTAIIGSTGAGKSSLVNLIPRFYDVSGGSILLDGVDIRQLPQAELRKQIGYVPQKSSLFSGTLESNLRFGMEAADESRLLEVAAIAQAREFIDERPEGLEAPVSQGGVNLSGGQKQRVSIARALTANPPVLIFDDSFSALDFRTDAALRRALDEKAGDATRIIVAQRVSTILKAEQIIVLEDGKIAGMGTHGELMKSCPEYREIVLSQISMEEAE